MHGMLDSHTSLIRQLLCCSNRLPATMHAVLDSASFCNHPEHGSGSTRAPLSELATSAQPLILPGCWLQHAAVLLIMRSIQLPSLDDDDGSCWQETGTLDP